MNMQSRITCAAVGFAVAIAAVPAVAAPYRDRAIEYGTPRTYWHPNGGEVAAGFIGGATLGLISPPGVYGYSYRPVPYAYNGGTLYEYQGGGDRLHNGTANF